MSSREASQILEKILTQNIWKSQGVQERNSEPLFMDGGKNNKS